MRLFLTIVSAVIILASLALMGYAVTDYITSTPEPQFPGMPAPEKSPLQLLQPALFMVLGFLLGGVGLVVAQIGDNVARMVKLVEKNAAAPAATPAVAPATASEATQA